MSPCCMTGKLSRARITFLARVPDLHTSKPLTAPQAPFSQEVKVWRVT